MNHTKHIGGFVKTPYVCPRLFLAVSDNMKFWETEEWSSVLIKIELSNVTVHVMEQGQQDYS